MFTLQDYSALHSIVFRDGYPGYKPSVKEIPNGDGKIDADKRFAHVAPKYLTDAVSAADTFLLGSYLQAAHNVAERAAEIAGIPAAFRPDIRYGALRVLDYPPGAVSNLHEDFDLFTLMMYRDQPRCFVSYDETKAADDARHARRIETIDKIRTVNAQAHLGQLGEAIGLGKATPHEVIAATAPQYSIVYFAIPDHDLILPTGETVRDWLNERMARSRTEFKKYE